MNTQTVVITVTVPAEYATGCFVNAGLEKKVARLFQKEAFDVDHDDVKIAVVDGVFSLEVEDEPEASNIL